VRSACRTENPPMPGNVRSIHKSKRGPMNTIHIPNMTVAKNYDDVSAAVMGFLVPNTTSADSAASASSLKVFFNPVLLFLGVALPALIISVLFKSWSSLLKSDAEAPFLGGIVLSTRETAYGGVPSTRRMRKLLPSLL